MTRGIVPDAVVQKELASRGVDATTGVFGEHRVQIGTGAPIRLDDIRSATVPFAGFRTATRIARGQAGVRQNADLALRTLASGAGPLDAGTLLGSLKAMQTQMNRLERLGQLSDTRRKDGLWAFTASVESLSNRELAAVYQSFTTSEMDLLQTALMREGQINPEATDARRAASMLFDLQALVLKEISNRSVIADMGKNPGGPVPGGLPGEAQEKAQPMTLTEQFGGQGSVTGHREAHDITVNNLQILTDVSARSATQREKTALQETERLGRRGLDSVTLKQMGDVLRSAELTMNVKTEFLIGGPNSILDHPDDPMVNMHHLYDQGVRSMGEGYRRERISTENALFPEMKDHVTADERPMYGALNIERRQIGALGGNAGYGRSAVVLKPEVARRATYIASDSFFSLSINMSQERRQNFYTLVAGSDMPESLRTALADPASRERTELEAYFDEIGAREGATVSLLNVSQLPASVQQHNPSRDRDAAEDFTSSLKALLTDCFADVEATRSIMATHDSLETLITHMDNVDGNALARSALQRQSGQDTRLRLTNINYIEAQIQGTVIPRRDIAEIRIDMDDVPEDERAALRVRARQYEQDTGIRVTLIDDSDPGKETDLISTAYDRQAKFNIAHLDETVLDRGKEDYLGHLDQYVQGFISSRRDLTRDLPPGMLRLEGNALARLGQRFLTAVDRVRRTPNAVDESTILEQAFEQAVMPVMQKKAELLHELVTLAKENPPMTENQLNAVASWVVSAADLRTPEELRVICRYAGAQAEMFREFLRADPPLSPEQILSRMHVFMGNLDTELTGVIESFNDPDFGADNRMTELNRTSFLALTMLQNADPPSDQQELRHLREILDSQPMRAMQSRLSALTHDPDLVESQDMPGVSLVVRQMLLNSENIAGAAGQAYTPPAPFRSDLSLIQEPLRTALRETAPDLARRLDKLHPGFAVMPQPNVSQAMPAGDAERRSFLISLMDGYRTNEQTFEQRTAVHGRGHIARAYIFASVLAGIMEERGVSVDRNAVLMGIAGHDIGRQGGGTDRWEARSADMTVEAMRNAFGPDTMGDAYEQEVRNSIDRHRGRTLEALLLNAADSLDIGRVGTGAFDLGKFPFLLPADGTEPGPEDRALREELAKEADLLQRLTNPLCANRRALDRLDQLTLQADSPEMEEYYMGQKEELLTGIEKVFEADRSVPDEAYMRRFEDVVRDNPQMFPVLSRYYH